MPMTDWSKFQQLSIANRILLGQSVFLLPLVNTGLFFLGYDRLYRVMQRLIPLNRVVAQNSEADVVQQAQKMAQIVAIAARRGFFQATCLRKSILVWGLLRRSGIQSCICFGVQLNDHQLGAHAWVEFKGYVINDAQDVRQRYGTFDNTSIKGRPFINNS